ncbi:hypothetical protein ABPG72_017329 [Tetrahymena utriculariae]
MKIENIKKYRVIKFIIFRQTQINYITIKILQLQFFFFRKLTIKIIYRLINYPYQKPIIQLNFFIRATLYLNKLIDKMDKYSCKCGQKYFTNSSLYNHIRLKHNNDLGMKQNILKMGRPLGTKNEVQIKRTKVKRVAYPCKCGSTLASRGALSNHWRLVHKSCEEYKPEVLEKGRKKASYDIKKIKVEKNNQIKQEYNDEQIEQNSNSDSTNTQHEDEQVKENELLVEVKQENIAIKDIIQVKQEQIDGQPPTQVNESSFARSEEQTYLLSQASLASPFNSIELTQPIKPQNINPFIQLMTDPYPIYNYSFPPFNYYNLCNFKRQNEFQPHIPIPQYYLPQQAIKQQSLALDYQQQVYLEKIKASKFSFLLPQSNQQQRTAF